MRRCHRKNGHRGYQRSASCASASPPAARISRWHRKRQERERRSARPRRRERKRRSLRECSRVQVKVCKTVQFSTSCGGCRQQCPGGPKHSDPTFAWQDDVKGHNVERLADTLFLQPSGCGPSCSTETKHLQDYRPSRSHRNLGRLPWVSTPELRRDNRK